VRIPDDRLAHIQHREITGSAMTILFRFIFGVVLAAGLGLWWQLSLPVNLVFALCVGAMAGIGGDKFILSFMSFMRYFR
jgi:hypothetical protein